jgi:hypothetical protein
MFRIVYWDVLPCKMIVDNHFTQQYIPEDNSEHRTRRRENLKSHREEKYSWAQLDLSQWKMILACTYYDGC